MAVAGAHAIRTGVTAANDNDMLAIGPQLAFHFVTGIDFVLLRQKLHRKVNASQIPSRYGQVARLFRATGQQHRVEVFLQLSRRHGFLGPVGDLGLFRHLAHEYAGANRDPFGLQLLHATVNV